MPKNSSTYTSQRNAAQSMTNVMNFFDKVDRANGGDGLVWVRSGLAAKGTQVILNIQNPSNNIRYSCDPIRPGEPVCLNTARTGIPFQALRESGDLHQAASRGVVRLMTSDEAKAYYAELAELTGTDLDDLMAEADAAQLRNKHAGMQTIEEESDIITPRIQYLMNEVSADLQDNERLPAAEVLKELHGLQEVLTLDDLELIAKKGFWDSVKKWAKKQIAARQDG